MVRPSRVVRALALALVGSCGPVDPGPPPPPEIPRDAAGPELRKILAGIRERKDVEAARARARIYSRLVALGESPAADLLSAGDAADVEVLSQPGPAEYRKESSARLSLHFRERARSPGLARGRFEGPLAGPLRRFVLTAIAATYGEYASRADYAESMDGLAAAAEEIAALETLKPEAQQEWHRRARLYALRGEELRREEALREPSPEARAFCEAPLAAHLEEAPRAADRATTERAAQGGAERILEWRLRSLSHYVLAEECLPEPTQIQKLTLAAMEIVVRSLGLDLCRP
jgi:hypothetical protein